MSVLMDGIMWGAALGGILGLTNAGGFLLTGTSFVDWTLSSVGGTAVSTMGLQGRGR